MQTIRQAQSYGLCRREKSATLGREEQNHKQLNLNYGY
jgi:hypothetical protein